MAAQVLPAGFECFDWRGYDKRQLGHVQLVFKAGNRLQRVGCATIGQGHGRAQRLQPCLDPCIGGQRQMAVVQALDQHDAVECLIVDRDFQKQCFSCRHRV
ncbi:MAG: hypothetical protein NT117_05065 [Gammaproteobacteria bacterium]|nr:hypothetical protein [Gammaproteobacteria bacterium]